MPYNAIFKLVSDTHRAIHRICVPDIREKGFYVEALKRDGFCNGKRRNATEWEKQVFRDGCTWAPWGMYYTLTFNEDDWARKNSESLESLSRVLPPEIVSWHDESKFPVVDHPCIDDFFRFVGFDRKRRRYSTTLSPYGDEYLHPARS